MTTQTITIEVDPQSARAFSEASPEDRRKLQLLLSLRLRDLTANPGKSLTAVMDEIGVRAEERGLTAELLASLLHGE
jgi:hypothetical protein